MVKKISLILIIFFGFSFSLPAADFVNFLGMRFTQLPAGSFFMGSCKPKDGVFQKKTGIFGLRKVSVCPSGGKADMAASENELPQHKVTISRSFQMAVHEVTYDQYSQFLKANGGVVSVNFKKHNSRKSNSAVVWVSWFQARSFIDWVNVNKPSSDQGTYRLPTEAEWEYAARGGSTDPYFFGDKNIQIGRYAWIIKDSHSAGGIWSQPVGQKQPNPFGLYDIYGNVWEWVQDVYAADYYKNSPAVDPKGPDTGVNQVLRGCSLFSNAVDCRSANRHFLPADGRNGTVGFRLVRELP